MDSCFKKLLAENLLVCYSGSDTFVKFLKNFSGQLYTLALSKLPEPKVKITKVI